MNKRKYKKKCKALFKKAKELNVILEFNPEEFDCHRLDCIWYGGTIAMINVSDTFAIQLRAEGDVRACLTDRNGDVIASVKDKNNCGAFADEMRTYFKTDKQLYAAMDNESLTLGNNNWIEYDGIVKVDASDECGTFIDLGMICDNFLDNNVLLAVEQVLDSIEEIKAEIIDVADVEYGIKVGDV